MNEIDGFPCPGDSNWTICSHLRQFCFGNFQTFPLSYWGAISYYPRGLIMGKVEFTQLQRILMPGPSTISLLYDPFLAGINPHRTSGTPYTSRMPLFSSLFSIKCFPPERNKSGETRTSRSWERDLFRAPCGLQLPISDRVRVPPPPPTPPQNGSKEARSARRPSAWHSAQVLSTADKFITLPFTSRSRS